MHLQHDNGINHIESSSMHEREVYIVLSEWDCDWRDEVEISPTAYLRFEDAQAALNRKTDDAIRKFSASPTIERCEGYCELSTDDQYGTDSVCFTVHSIRIPAEMSEYMP